MHTIWRVKISKISVLPIIVFFFFFFLEEQIVEYIYSISCCTMGKEKRGSKQWPPHFLLQVATLARTRATQLHLKRNKK